mmetsp:Transcript_8923/g.21465  ORF Transcript_8923/g.21465 Transcript_8923/m.21465 type:complete len:227 (-) Transcript_8923:742-1422(-)
MSATSSRTVSPSGCPSESATSATIPLSCTRSSSLGAAHTCACERVPSSHAVGSGGSVCVVWRRVSVAAGASSTSDMRIGPASTGAAVLETSANSTSAGAPPAGGAVAAAEAAPHAAPPSSWCGWESSSPPAASVSTALAQPHQLAGAGTSFEESASSFSTAPAEDGCTPARAPSSSAGCCAPSSGVTTHAPSLPKAEGDNGRASEQLSGRGHEAAPDLNWGEASTP